MKLHPILVGAAMVAFLASTGCSNSPGRPGKESEVIRQTKLRTSIFSTLRTAQDATVRTARAGQPSLWRIPFFSQLRTTPQFAASLPTVCALLQCPRSRRVQGECSLTNKSMPWCKESDLGKNPILSATLVRRLIWRRLLAIQNVAQRLIRRIVLPVMEWTAVEEARPARSWMDLT